MEETLIQIQRWMPIIAIAVVGLLLAVVAVLSVHYRKKDRAEMEPLAQALGGEYVSTKHASYIRLRAGDSAARLELDDGGGECPPMLALSRPAGLDFMLCISRKGAGDQAPEAGGNRVIPWLDDQQEFTTGDPTFDGKYLLRSDEVERAKNFLNASAKRVAVDYLFSKQFSWVFIQDHCMHLQKEGYTASDLLPDQIRGYLEQLAIIAADGV